MSGKRREGPTAPVRLGKGTARVIDEFNAFNPASISTWFSLLLTLALVHHMTRHRLPPVWRGVLLAFLGVTLWRYPAPAPALWGGDCALLAIYCAWRDIGGLYTGKTGLRWLAASGVFTALAVWATPGAGLLSALALTGFGLFQALLHEREERGVPFGRLPRQAVARRWLRRWGHGWLLPLLALEAFRLSIPHTIPFPVPSVAGIFPSGPLFFGTSGAFPGSSPTFGYFTTFHREFAEIFRLPPKNAPFLPELASRLAGSIHLPLIGALPLIGILGAGSALPARFLYRTLHPENEERLLFLLASTALIAATLTHSTAARIAANGAIPFTLGIMVLRDWLSAHPRTARAFWLAGTLWLLLLAVSLF